MYRDDQEAAFARIQVLQKELDDAQGQAVQDKQRIALLVGQLQATQQALARMGGQLQYQYPGQHDYQFPSRSGTVLTLGILSLAVCTVLGPIAWSMGNEEIRRIDSGLTSPMSRGSVTAGRVCGIVATCFLMLAAAMIFFMLVTIH
ncbi:MAG TPA: hypothetical protein VLX92_33815 [Kofleriaceae bacterium]|nr:hypothetical protein [Kofleriaceae bacterium]